MLPDRVSNPGPLTYESGALRIVLRGPAITEKRLLRTGHIYIYLGQERSKYCTVLCGAPDMTAAGEDHQ